MQDVADGSFSDHEAIADDELSISMADNAACYYMSGLRTSTRTQLQLSMQKNYEDTATSEYAEELRGHSHI